MSMEQVVIDALREALSQVEYSADVEMRLKLLKAEKEMERLKTEDK